MANRTLSLLLTGVLVTSVLSLVPAGAQEAAEPITIPDEVAIDDPFGDANYLNDQGLSGDYCLEGQCQTVPWQGNNGTPQDAGSVSDLGKIWFTNDAQSISVHVQTELPHSEDTLPLFYRVQVDPGDGSNCLWFQAGTDGNEGAATLRDLCATAIPTSEGELTLTEGPDGTGIMTLTFPFDAHPALEIGNVLATPAAHSRNSVVVVTAPEIDNTEIGTDYAIAAPSGGKAKPKKDKKKNCNKIKNKKKKKACKKQQKKNKKPKTPAAKGCAAYQPGELGAEAETTVVTDAATEEEPIVIDVPIGPALGSDFGLGFLDLTDRVAHNVQVDTKSDEAGLYVRLETPEIDDPDLYVYWNNGTEAASAGGFNLTPVGPFDGTGSGGHSEMGAEQIDGLRTADCVGYDLDLVNWLGVGGTYTLKLWLGEIQNDPAPRDG